VIVLLKNFPDELRRRVPLGKQRPRGVTRGDVVLTVPNPHRGDIGVGLLSVILH